ncbi:MAG: hypothetical protein FWG18_00720 [Alphaproteobacteria bacterium]|nr:hypothetical protein [Alphaproteobacteria bacterium]
MKFDKDVHHRRTIRKRGYDYSNPGAYFITICTHEKQCIFGHIQNGEMILNNVGKIVKNCLLEIPNRNNRTQLHEWVIMPNHSHFIIEIQPTVEIMGSGRAQLCAPTTFTANEEFLPQQSNSVGAHNCAHHGLRPGDKIGTLAHIIRGFKSAVSKQIGKQIWQRNYYEHIVRDNDDYREIANYIKSNPRTWDSDKLYQKQLDEFYNQIM